MSETHDDASRTKGTTTRYARDGDGGDQIRPGMLLALTDANFVRSFTIQRSRICIYIGTNMKILLWAILIIFLIGLAVVTGFFKLIF
ncbi:MAG: hypothetical protein EOO27_16470 [Comamonadaceae bacterium]|nr:MAG: hypothetical protein EOO27_16470 [Comamonadaceae bacterium]